ncbi:hypothetical protein J3R30DRAFT_1427049 [Lentinula aciculospora]|uniref:Zn(2)-C6 fungal-type domain-containing protein n=1 Tax=Lentinula aciculospora TaxID=153920 RepID=A0A9W9ALS5_9AGAR|nr:hypothetical protein J3R30DRAFT_1427049 [Lentinula aciculospora]
MPTRRSSEQSFEDFYLYPSQPFMSSSSSHDFFSSVHHPSQQTSHSTVRHPESTSSQQQTRHFVYSQDNESNSFAQFLKEDDERFFATFPEAAKAAAQQQQQQWLVLGNNYRDFHGSAAFNLSANNGTYAYPSPTSPVHASNVVDVIPGSQGIYPALYADSASSSHASFPYTLDPSSCDGVPPENEYIQHSESVPVPPDVIQPASPFTTAPFYSQPIAEDHPDIHVLQHDSIMPLSLPSPSSVHASGQSRSPQLLRLGSPPMNFLRSSSEMSETVFSPMEAHHSQMYSLSPEAMIAPSPSPTLSFLPSTLSPVSMATPPEQLTLPPLPSDPQSDSEPLADDSSGASSSKTVLTKPSIRRKRRRNLSEELQSNSSRSAPRPRPVNSSSSQSEKKSLALACFFCRGRKIACGPQDPNSADRTCNQCHRRSLKCEYPTESRRGMRKRKSVVLNSSFRAEKEFEPPAPKLAISSTSSSSKV